MEPQRFDSLSRSLAGRESRREVLRGLFASSLGLGLAQLPGLTAARKRRKRKKDTPKRPKPNAFGCLNVEDACTKAAQCCSGICAGKKGKKRCRAHDTADCQAGDTLVGCFGEHVTCTTSTGLAGRCGTTTGNAGYCLSAVRCWPCKTDRDCQTANGGAFGPRAACLPCATCPETRGTVCANPTFPS